MFTVEKLPDIKWISIHVHELTAQIQPRFYVLTIWFLKIKIMLDIYATMCKIAGGQLLYSPGSSAQCSVMTWRSGMEEWEGGSRGTGYLYTLADSWCCTVATSTTL